MATRLDYAWHLRLRMAERGLFGAPDLARALRERGVVLSDSQVWRLVTGKPERLNLGALVALCDILGCTPNDLIEPVEAAAVPKRRKQGGRTVERDITPRRARVRRGGRAG